MAPTMSMTRATIAPSGRLLKRVPSSLTYSARLAVALRERDYRQTLETFEAMRDMRIEPTKLDVHHVAEARAFREGPAAALAALRGVRVAARVKQQACGAIIAACSPSRSRGADWPTAQAAYGEMVAAGVVPDGSVYSTLVYLSALARDYSGAEALLGDSPRGVDGHPADSETLLMQFARGCLRARDPEHALRVLERMKGATSADYAELARGFLGAGHHEGVAHCLAALEADPTALAGVRDELGEFVRRGLERAHGHGGAPDDVIGAVAIARRLGVEPTQYQLVGAHLAHLEKGDGVGAFANYLGMLDRGFALKPRLRDALADQLAQQAELADEAYYHLDARHTGGHGVPLDAVDVVVEACARLGDLDRAFATFGELERFGVRPGVSTYNALLHACVNSRELASGRRLLSAMDEEGVAADAETYGHRCSLHLMSGGRLDGAVRLFDECKAAGLVPVSRTYVTLINLHLRRGSPDDAASLLAEMGEHHRVPENFVRKVREAIDGQD